MPRTLALEPKRQAGVLLTGAIQPVGSLGVLKLGGPPGIIPLTLIGSWTPAGEVVGVAGGESLVTVLKSVAGSISPSGAVASVVVPGEPLSIATFAAVGTITPHGTVAGVVGGESLVTVPKSLSGRITPAGSLAKDVLGPFTKFIAGLIQPAGDVAGVKSGPDLVTLLKSLNGQITPAGAVARSVDNTPVPDFSELMGGTITPAGSVVGVAGGESLITITKSIAGTITPAGALATQSAGNRSASFGGTLTPHGVVVGVAGGPSLITVPKSIGGSLVPSGVLALLVIAPPITFFSVALSATITPHGTVSTQVNGPSLVTVPKALQGGIQPVGAVAGQVSGPSLVTVPKSLSGAWQPTGVVVSAVSGNQKITKSVAGSLTPHGTVSTLVGGGGGPIITNSLYASMGGIDMSELDQAPGWPAITFTQVPSTTNNIKAMLDGMRSRGIKGGLGLISPNSYGTALGDGTFNFEFATYKGLVDKIAAVANIASYIADGTCEVICAGDELQHPKWNGTIPPDTRKQMLQYIKQQLPGVKTSLRMPHVNLSGSELPTNGWEGTLDYGWAQYTGPFNSASSGFTAIGYFQYQRDHLAQLGVGIITGGNWWNGGDGSSGIAGPAQGTGTNDKWVMTPEEIITCIDAAITIDEAKYHMWWNDANGSNLSGADAMLILQNRADYAAAFLYSKTAGLARGGATPQGPYFISTNFFVAPAPPTLNVGTAIRDSLTNHKVFKLIDNARTQYGDYSALNDDNSIIYFIQAGVGMVGDVTWNIAGSIVQVGNQRNAFGPTGSVAGVVDGVVWIRGVPHVFIFAGAVSAKVYKRDVVAVATTLLKDFAVDGTYSSFWSGRGISATTIKGLHSDRNQDHVAALVVNSANSAVVGAVAWDRSDGRIWLYSTPAGKTAIRVNLDDSGQYMKINFSDKSWENVELISNNFTQQLGVISDITSPPLDDDSVSLKMFQALGFGVYSRTFEPADATGTQIYPHPVRSGLFDPYSMGRMSMLSTDDICYYTMYYNGPSSHAWTLHSGSIYKLNWATVMAANGNKRIPEVVRQGKVQLTKVG